MESHAKAARETRTEARKDPANCAYLRRARRNNISTADELRLHLKVFVSAYSQMKTTRLKS